MRGVRRGSGHKSQFLNDEVTNPRINVRIHREFSNHANVFAQYLANLLHITTRIILGKINLAFF